jgi:alkanesulfonate monooxygenase SsuD/methylene tetrahydromethanopterin reductase-like flavin-dependent oxidoreductase (luciferase family)
MSHRAPFNQSRAEWTQRRFGSDPAAKHKPGHRPYGRWVRADLHFYATVPMPDAGAGAPFPTDRRTTNQAVVETYENLCHWAVLADELGYDTFWLTEHHFQHEGYEVTPNLILFGLHLAGLTKNLKMGQAFNVVPQWHPLRLAEDFATADILSGGRMVFGVGRGTVPRESQTLGAPVASGDNVMSREADRINRERFEEGMEAIKMAWTQERFAYKGQHLVYPPPGIPDRGKEVTELTLVPRPLRDIEIYQPVGSPRTLSYVAQQGHNGVFALASPERTKTRWDQFAEEAAKGGRNLAPGEGRCIQMMIHVGTTTEEAIARVRPGHDEYVKFLTPYGRFQQFAADLPFDYTPTLEETRACRAMAIGSVEDVVEVLGEFRDLLDLKHVLLFPDFPGLTREEMDEQLVLLAEEVMPRLGAELRVTGTR